MNNQISPKAFVYARVNSSNPLAQPTYFSNQHAMCLEYCKLKGYDVVETFNELGGALTLNKRPQLQTLLQKMEAVLTSNQPIKPKVVLVTTDWSRLSRDTLLCVHLKQLSVEMGFQIEFAEQTIPPQIPQLQIMMGKLTELNQ